MWPITIESCAKRIKDFTTKPSYLKIETTKPNKIIIYWRVYELKFSFTHSKAFSKPVEKIDYVKKKPLQFFMFKVVIKFKATLSSRLAQCSMGFGKYYDHAKIDYSIMAKKKQICPLPLPMNVQCTEYCHFFHHFSKFMHFLYFIKLHLKFFLITNTSFDRQALISVPISVVLSFYYFFFFI